MKRLKIILQSNIVIGLLFSFIIIYILISTKVVKYSSKYNISDTLIQGIVLNYSFDGDKLSLTIKAREKIIANYYIKNEDELEYLKTKIEYGSKVLFKGTLKEPLNNTIPNTFNYKEYLYNQHIFYIFNVDSYEVNNNKNILYKFKNSISKRINKIDKSGYLQAFLLGNKNYMNEVSYDNYKDNGVTHLFAVSGMHISIFSAFLFAFLKKLKLKEDESYIIVFNFLIFYAFLVGFSASALRATIFMILIYINKRINLNIKTIYILYYQFLLFLLINPFYIYDIGFLYSFATSFGIILFSKKLTGIYFVKLFKTSLVAFLFSLPITLYNFYEINFFSIIANIIIVPIVSIIVFPLSIIVFICPFLNVFLLFTIKILEFISGILANISIFNLTIAKINILFIILYYLFLFLIYKKGTKYIILVIILLLIFKIKPYLNSNNYVYFLDVDQGDASLIVSENMRDVILIDTGGKVSFKKDEWKIKNREFNLSSNIVTFLKSLGISRINLLAISHGDMDHLGYAKDILKEIKVDKMMFNNNTFNKYENEIIDKNKLVFNYQSKYINIVNLNDNNSLDENISSLVLKINLDGLNLLYMGDAPKEVEREIILKHNLTSDIIKIGHHGSKTSSDYYFLKKINASFAIISSGRNNRYNHPSLETIDTLNKLKINYFNTQDKGTIMFKYKNKKLNYTFCYP